MNRALVTLIVFGILLSVLTAPVLIPLVSYLIADVSFFDAITLLFPSLDIFSTFADYYSGFSFSDLPSFIGLIICWMIALQVVSWIKSDKKNSDRKSENGILGDQESISDPKKILKKCFSWDGSSPNHPGFVIGFLERKYVITPAKRVALCAPSGSYKTRGSLLGSVACMSYGGETNLVITDPSLEIHCYTSPMLKKRGYKELYIDFENPFRGCRINFLAPLINLHRQNKDYLVEERAAEIGQILFPETGRGNTDSFTQPAAGLLSAVSYLVATLDEVPDECRHLYSVIQILTVGTINGDTTELKDWLRSFGSDSPAVAMSATFLTATGKYETSILGSLYTGLRPFSTSAMRYLISCNDVDLDDFLKSKSVLILHTLSGESPANKLASLLCHQLWAAAVRNGQRRGSIRPTCYLLDEAQSLPPIPLQIMSTQGRKYGVSFMLVLQSFSGLDQYTTSKEDGKDIILSNCDTKCLFRAGDIRDAEYFEKLSGKTTILSKNTGKSRNPNGSISSNTGYSERERPVWLAGDILKRSPREDGILVVQNSTEYPDMIGNFEIPIKDVSQVPFMVDQLGTIGPKEYEEKVIQDEIDRLDANAASRIKNYEVNIWIPTEIKLEDNGKDDQTDLDLFGL